jgi:hypothetical protein
MDSFIRLLEDILNPAELPEARELDSVFQLRSQVRTYYERKGELNDSLTETLYAMMKERPNIILSKRKYFFKNNDRDPADGHNDHNSIGTSTLTVDKADDEVVLGESPRSSPHTKKIRNLCFELE